MKIQEYISEIQNQFFEEKGMGYGISKEESKALFDAVFNQATAYIQKWVFSGKMDELKNLVSGGAEGIRNSSYYKELVADCASKFTQLSWEMDKKEALAGDILQYLFEGLKNKFEEGGYSKDLQGVLSFAGLDGGLLGKLGGMFGGIGKMFK